MLRRLGFPDASRHRALVIGIGIDALGSGVFMPVSILYFLMTTDVGKARVGLAISLAALAAVPFVLLAGTLVDRFGAKRVVLAGNLIQAGAFTGYLWADSFWSIVAVETLAALGQSAFWSAYSPLVAASTPAGEREIWFGFLGALRNVGFAVGGLASGIAVTIGTDAAYHAVVVLNAASYVLAFCVLLRVSGGERPAAAWHDEGTAPPSGWGCSCATGAISPSSSATPSMPCARSRSISPCRFMPSMCSACRAGPAVPFSSSIPS